MDERWITGRVNYEDDGKSVGVLTVKDEIREAGDFETAEIPYAAKDVAVFSNLPDDAAKSGEKAVTKTGFLAIIPSHGVVEIGLNG